MIEQDAEHVRAASNRIVGVLDQLRKDRYFGPDVLHLALVDAGVRLGRFYLPKLKTVELLRSISSLVLEMVKDEENEIRTKALQRSREH